MLKSLASVHNNLYVVGDEDQSIYRWRGADYRNILRFEKDYPKATKLLLEQNYRSTQNVLDAAQSVIDHNSNRTPKKLFTERGQGVKIVLYEAADDRAEAAFVVDTITQLDHLRSGQRGGFCDHVSHQCTIPLVGGNLPAGWHSLPPGGRTAILWPTGGEGCDRLFAAGPQPG